MAGRTIAIGDIHGCSTALRVLLNAIHPTNDDTVVTLGDYVNRGPDSPGVLDELIALGEKCKLISLTGNHEEMFLSALRHSLDGGAIAAPEEAISPQHLHFLRNCRDYFETETHIFVHANYLPHHPMDRQPTQYMRWEFLNPLWAKEHFSGKSVIVGHTSQKSGEILDLGFLKCIDTYCYGGGWLTALEVNTGLVWQANQQGLLRA
jgi:serine/threonine protein phosphatase 1